MAIATNRNANEGVLKLSMMGANSYGHGGRISPKRWVDVMEEEERSWQMEI